MKRSKKSQGKCAGVFSEVATGAMLQLPQDVCGLDPVCIIPEFVEYTECMYLHVVN